MKRISHLILAAATAMTLTACHRPAHAEAKQQAEQRWNEVRARVKLQLARQQYDGGLFHDVLQSASESITLDPSRPDAYVLLAQANLELAKPASAERALQAAGRAGLDSPDLRYMRGVLLEQHNDLKAAVTEYAQACAMNPDNVDYLVARAECLVALDHAEEALALLDENMHRFDNDGTIALLAGRIATLLGDWEGAAQRLGQAAVTLGDSPVIAEELGLLFVRADRCGEALALLRPLVEAADGSEGGAVRRGMAKCYMTLGDPKSAEAVLIDYARRHPDDGSAQLLLAKAAVEVGDLLTAARAADLAEQQAPECPDVRLTQAAIRWRRTEYASAADTLYGLLERDGTNVEAYCLLAEVLRAQRQDDAARDCFRRALRLDPQSVWARRGLALLGGTGDEFTPSAAPLAQLGPAGHGSADVPAPLSAVPQPPR